MVYKYLSQDYPWQYETLPFVIPFKTTTITLTTNRQMFFTYNLCIIN